MLVLKRRTSEQIFIVDKNTDEIVTEIKILGIIENHVKIGFEANARYSILRPDMKKKESSFSLLAPHIRKIERKLDGVYNR